MELGNIINLFKEAVEEGNESRIKEHFYFSEGAKCDREIYYHLIHGRSEEKNSFESTMRMKMGKLIELGLSDYWKKTGLLHLEQHRIEIPIIDTEDHYFALNGYTDFILKDDEGYKIVNETKTFYGPYAKKDYANGKAKEAHIIQLGLYIYFLIERELLTRVRPWGFIHYISRDDMSNYFVKVEVDMRLEEIHCGEETFSVPDILESFEEVANNVIDGEIPKPQFHYKYSPERARAIIKKEGWSKQKITSKMRTDFMEPQLGIDGEPLRNGRNYVYVPKSDAVTFGDWQCKYCAFKSRCLSDRGIEQGYDQEELLEIINTFEELRKC